MEVPHQDNITLMSGHPLVHIPIFFRHHHGRPVTLNKVLPHLLLFRPRRPDHWD